MSLVICALFRNEARYLREWIEFHRIVGVEAFYLYQNRSDDDWQSILLPYVEQGVVVLVDWPQEPPSQLLAYHHFISGHKGQSLWTAFIDCDEFLFSPRFPTISEALSEERFRCGALGVNWMCFGSSQREQWTDQPVIERFTLRPADHFGPNVHIKSIVRMDQVEGVGPDPHHFHVRCGTVNEAGELVSGPFTAKASHQLLRINHYVTKSREEYRQRIALGRADLARSRELSEYDHYQAQEVDDHEIWRFLPELKVRLATKAG